MKVEAKMNEPELLFALCVCDFTLSPQESKTTAMEVYVISVFEQTV